IKRAHFTDRSVVKSFEELKARGVRAPAETGLHGQPFSLCLLGALPNRADASDIRRDGFFEKSVFVCGHRRLEVLRANTRRPRQLSRATLSRSRLAANDSSGKLRVAANTDPSAAVAEAFKNCRREVEAVEEPW